MPTHTPLRSLIAFVSDLSISRSRASHPHILFEKLDALQAGAADALRRLAGKAKAGETAAAEAAPASSNAFSGGSSGGSSSSFSKVFIDINGNRPLLAVAGVLQMVLHELAGEGELKLVVVKSRELHDAVAARRGGPADATSPVGSTATVELPVAFEPDASRATPSCPPVEQLASLWLGDESVVTVR